MTAPIKSLRTLTSDLDVLQRETGMAMATIASLTDDELAKPTRCAGWTRGHLIAHLALDAHVMADLAAWAVGGRDAPTPRSRDQRDADIEAIADRPARELIATLAGADARLSEAFRALRGGVREQAVPTPCCGEVDAFALPSHRTTEVIVHHDDLDTTWEWHEADPDATVDAIGVCMDRLRAHSDPPGLHVVAREGEEWSVGDGSQRVEGYDETLLPFLARGQVEHGLQHDGVLPTLPPW